MPVFEAAYCVTRDGKNPATLTIASRRYDVQILRVAV
jgi:hypothetical protein